jgi:hypothetical protein
MKHVAARIFRIRQLAPRDYVAEERTQEATPRNVFGLFGKAEQWARLDSAGKVATWPAIYSSVDYARAAIEARKERLSRADEFPVTVETLAWDGVPELRAVAAGWSSR